MRARVCLCGAELSHRHSRALGLTTHNPTGFGGSGPSASSFPALGGSGSLGDGMAGMGMGMLLGGGGLPQEAGALGSSNSSSFDGAGAFCVMGGWKACVDGCMGEGNSQL